MGQKRKVGTIIIDSADAIDTVDHTTLPWETQRMIDLASSPSQNQRPKLCKNPMACTLPICNGS
jgi:hypothetical protein